MENEKKGGVTMNLAIGYKIAQLALSANVRKKSYIAPLVTIGQVSDAIEAEEIRSMQYEKALSDQIEEITQ